MHWDAYASVVGDTRIALKFPRAYIPWAEQAVGGVGASITAVGAAGSL
jgi:hypothetical protein